MRVAARDASNCCVYLCRHKWLGNRAVQLRAAGKQVLFAYEEAIGFCIGDLVKDKDGVTAAAVFAEFYKAILSEGFTVASVRGAPSDPARKY